MAQLACLLLAAVVALALPAHGADPTSFEVSIAGIVQRSPAVRAAPPHQVAGIREGAATVWRLGAALQPTFARQWAALLASTHRDFQGFARKVQRGVSSASAVAVADMIAELNKTIGEEKAKVRDWVETQGRDASELATKYTSLIRERLQADAQDAADETAIYELRSDDQDLITKWEVELLGLVGETRSAFKDIVRQAAEAASSDSVKEDVKSSGKQMLWRLIDEQVRTTDLLLAKQISQFSVFAVRGASVLLQIALAAQADSL